GTTPYATSRSEPVDWTKFPRWVARLSTFRIADKLAALVFAFLGANLLRSLTVPPIPSSMISELYILLAPVGLSQGKRCDTNGATSIGVSTGFPSSLMPEY